MVNCSGPDEEWDYIGVEEWPSIDAIKEREKFENEELEVHKYAESKTYLGSAESFSEYGKDVWVFGYPVATGTFWPFMLDCHLYTSYFLKYRHFINRERISVKGR